jgi:hypothetical protein
MTAEMTASPCHPETTTTLTFNHDPQSLWHSSRRPRCRRILIPPLPRTSRDLFWPLGVFNSTPTFFVNSVVSTIPTVTHLPSVYSKLRLSHWSCQDKVDQISGSSYVRDMFPADAQRSARSVIATANMDQSLPPRSSHTVHTHPP